MKKLYLVDVSSMFYRAFYAIPPLRTSSGIPTNALYGFLAMSIKLLREKKPDYMVYCFDRKEPSFRHEMYAEYKANRAEMPEDLQPQVPYIRELTDKLGILAIDKEKFEADDVIGTLAIQGAKHNLDVLIVSGDKDFAQMVGPRITLYDTMKEVSYDREGVVAKWGVEPEQIVDYLAIVGDTSDNIPGVRGVGPKGAQKLLSEYKTLDNIYKHINEIKSESLRNKLIESKENAMMARRLVTIATNVDLDLSLADMQLKAINKEKLKTLLDKFEFSTFMRKLFGEEEEKDKAPQITQINESSLAALKPTQWSLSQLKENIEPYSEIWVVKNERGFCLGYEDKAIQIDGSLEEIGEMLGQKMLKWKGFDVKSIWHAIRLPTGGTAIWDSMLAAYVVKAGESDDFAKIYALYTTSNVPELATVEEILHCERKLESILRQKLQANNGLKVFAELELPLIPVLYDIERYGVLVDKEELKNQSRDLQTDISRIEKEIHELAGESFNISSPKQLAKILFENLKVPLIKKTKTGYSTDSDVLSKFSSQFSICDFIIQYRELTKLKSTYVDALPELVDIRDGRLHTHFHQAVTLTGRLSSTNPNLQNIPVRTERGRAVRRAFISPKDKVFLSVDYSQIELRVLAEITSDPGLIEAFLENQDVHAATAAEIFNVGLDAVTADQRRIAKAVNFGIAYGQGVFGLSETLEIPQDEAKNIIENYFKKFSKVKDYMLDAVELAKKNGYVETLFGRRRYIDEFKSSNAAIRKFGERAAINAPMQGTASDIMKMAMIQVHANCKSPILLQVHDELLLECSANEVEEEAQVIKEIMESIVKLKVPLKVNVAWGDTWESAHA
ncbi:MAG: DNA polymerase I [Bdellovibrionales bacterium RBG_16_40_8]|nr:MAG: DNA polymerase I [Bdellovibrionales bacterium RBG_16_40_8]